MSTFHQMSNAEHLRLTLKDYERRVKETKEKLDKVVENCINHSWSEVFFVSGQEDTHNPNTFYVMPSSSKWLRKCTNCGHVQVTANTKFEIGKDGLRKEYPLWP